MREGFAVDGLVVEDGTVLGVRGRGRDGTSVVEAAHVVIGADGRNSPVAKAVGAERYHEKPKLQWSYYSYFRDLPVDGFETYVRPDRGWAAAATNDGLTMLVVGWPFAQAQTYKADIEANYRRTLELAPDFAERVDRATRMERFKGGSIANVFRRPFGPGWVLVGDAGYTKDPITAQGICDAFRDAERCAAVLHDSFTGAGGFEDGMARYQQERDTHALPIYEFTTQLATLEPPPPQMQQLLGAVHGHREAMDEFVSVTAGTMSPAEFFDPAHVGSLVGTAGG